MHLLHIKTVDSKGLLCDKKCNLRNGLRECSQTGENYLNPTAVSDDLDEHIIHGKTTSTRFWYMSSSFLSASLNFLTNCYQSKFFQMTTILQIFYRFILLQINISSQMESHL